MRALTVVSGVILTLAGILCFANPGATFGAIAFLLGVAMLVGGATDILTYIAHHNRLAESGWQLAEGIITAVMAVVVLANQITADVVVPVFFGLWAIFCGTSRAMASLVLKEVEVPAWPYGLMGGVFSGLAGVCAFVRPVMDAMPLISLLGLIFLLHGVNRILTGLNMKKTKRKKKERVERKRVRRPEELPGEERPDEFKLGQTPHEFQ